MKRIALLLIIIVLIVLPALSQENSQRGNDTCYNYQERKIIANTFLENNYLHKELDTCNSILGDYKDLVKEYTHKDTLNSFKMAYTQDALNKQTDIINTLREDLKKETRGNKIGNLFKPIAVGFGTISIVETLYLLLKK